MTPTSIDAAPLVSPAAIAPRFSRRDRFEILTEVPLPITEAAHDLLASQNADCDLVKIQLKADSKTLRMVTIDLVVVDTESSGAGAYDVKRGDGTTESRKRRPIELDLRAGRLVLASFLAKYGYDGVRSVTSAVIDHYGASGFSKEMKLTREELDGHFGVPVLDTIEAMTTELQRALHAEMRNLLMPALTNLPHRSRTARRGHHRSTLGGGDGQGRDPRNRDRSRAECASDRAGAVARAHDLATGPQSIEPTELGVPKGCQRALRRERRRYVS